MFRPWHPPAQRAPHPNRPGQRAAPSRAHPQSEDAQPNEFVNKRQGCPPAVSSGAAHNQPPRRGGRVMNTVACRDRQFIIWEPTGRMRRLPPPHSGVSATYPELPPPATGGGPRHPTAARPTNDIASRLGSFPSTSSMPTVDALTPKRRKLESAPPPEIKREFPTEVMASTFASVSPVSSVTLVGDLRVKRERSISPELSAEPQPIAAGSKRYAPLPSECKKSQPNYRAARNAWARKEQEALKRLGLRVVRTLIREDGMVIDWEAIDTESADTAAAIERALLLNDAAIRNQPVAKRSTPSLARTSQGPNRARAEGESNTQFVVEASLENRDRHPSGGESGSRASVGQMMIDTSWDPSQEGPGQQQESTGHTSPRWQTAVNALDPPAHGTPSDHSHLSMYRQTTSNESIFPSSRAWTPSPSVQPPRTSEQRTASTQPSPSQRATLRHILELKRKAGRGSSSLPKPPAISPSPLSSPRKLYPPLPTESPSKRSSESFADAVAAAINESSRLDRVGSGGTPAPSTPLRLYQKRPSRSPAVDSAHGIERSPMPHSEAGHPAARRSLSSGRHSSPPIAVLSPTDSPPENRRVDLASSSAYGDEYDELELSYPSSPLPPPQEVLPEPHPLTIFPTTSQASVELAELALKPPLSDNGPPSSGENAVVRSAALQYLERYFQTFDMDRHALAGAYAPDATFSCTPRNVRARGRDDIVDALWALSLGALCSDNNVEYDVTYLDPDIGALLVVLGTISGARDSGEVGYTMSFVLRPARQDQKIPTGDPWPLVATVHQMVLREARS